MKKIYKECKAMVIMLEAEDIMTGSGYIEGTNSNEPIEMPEIPLTNGLF